MKHPTPKVRPEVPVASCFCRIIENRLIKPAMLFFFACGLVATPTLAQERAATKAAEDKEEAVIMSAFEVSSKGDDGYFKKNTLMGTRSAERLINIPQSIQIIPRELIEDIGLDNGIEVMKYASSGINRRSSWEADLYMRGFRVTAFLRDGADQGGGAFVNPRLYDTDRIEVIKGPNAMIFGQEAKIGGMVNYVTKKPSDRAETSIKATVGSFSMIRGEVNSTGPLGSTGINYRVTVGAMKADGARKFEHDDDKFFSLTLEKKISDSTTASFYLSHATTDLFVAQLNVDSAGNLIAVPDDFSFAEDWTNTGNKLSSITANLKTSFTPDFSMVVDLSWSEENLFWERVTPLGNTNAVTGLLNRRFQSIDYGTPNQRANLSLDFLKSFTTGGLAHKVTFGGSASGRSQNFKVDSVAMPALDVYHPVYVVSKPTFTQHVATPGNPGPSSRTDRARQDSGYLAWQGSLLDNRVIFLGGLRYNQFLNTSDNYISGSKSIFKDHAMVKRYGIIGKPIDGMSIYYSYSEAFIFNNGVLVGGPQDGRPLLPSFGKNKEIGIKVESPDGRFFGGVAAFDLQLTNVRTNYVQSDGSPGISQSGLDRNKGYEVDFGVSLKNPLGQFQGIVTYYKGDMLDAKGVKPNGVANDTWSLMLSEAITSGGLKGLKFGFGSYHKGEVPFASSGGQAKTFYGDAYTTSMAFLSYGKDRYTVSLNVDNLFDKKFVEGGENATWIYLNHGRTFRVSAGYKF